MPLLLQSLGNFVSLKFYPNIYEFISAIKLIFSTITIAAIMKTEGLEKVEFRVVFTVLINNCRGLNKELIVVTTGKKLM